MTAITQNEPLAVPAGRVGGVGPVRHTLTLAWRHLVQIKRNPAELVDISIQPIMFVVLFGVIFGGQMSGSVEAYLMYALPGIIVQSALFATLTTAVGLNTDITKGVFDRLLSLPIARSAPLLGRVVADLVKQVWSLCFLVALGMLFGFRIQTGPLGMVAAALLLLTVALAMSWLSVLIGVRAQSPEKVQAYAFTLMMPLVFTSNAFVRTETLPSWLQVWTEVNPVTHLADAIRGLLVGGPVAGPAVAALVWAAIIAAVCAPLAVRAVKRRV